MRNAIIAAALVTASFAAPAFAQTAMTPETPMAQPMMCDQASIEQVESRLETMTQANREVARGHLGSAKAALASGDMEACVMALNKAMEGAGKI